MVDPAQADDRDVAQAIRDALTKYGPVPVTHMINGHYRVCQARPNPVDGSDICHNVPTQTPETKSVILTAMNIAVVRTSPFEFGQVNRTELPANLTAWYQDVVNCTDASASQTVTISKQTTHSESVTISQSVTNTLDVSMSTGTSFAGFSVSATIRVSTSHTTGTAKLEGDQAQTTRTGSATVAIPARSTAVAEFRVWPINFEVAFKTIMMVDGDLIANDKGLKRLSDVLPEAERTFPLAGHISSSEASDGEVIFHATQNDPLKCLGGAPVVVMDHPVNSAAGLVLGNVLQSRRNP